jgi:hypothetical protein
VQSTKSFESKTPDYPYLRSPISKPHMDQPCFYWVGELLGVFTSARTDGVSLLFLKNSTATAPVMTPTCPESAIRNNWPYSRFSSGVSLTGWGADPKHVVRWGLKGEIPLSDIVECGAVREEAD